MRIAVISAHTCPLAALGGKETGGMNVYVRESCRELGRQGNQIDIFTRSQNPEIPRVVHLDRNVRVYHIPAGPEEPYDKYCMIKYLQAFVDQVLPFGSTRYDVIHSHYWISGMIALALKDQWRVPIVHMYHTLGFLKNRVARSSEEEERAVRIKWEWEIALSVDTLVASHPLERALLVWHYDAPPERTHVIPCGVDLDLFRPLNRRGACRTLNLDFRPWLLFVGRLEPIKGLDTLLRAMYLLKQKELESLGNPALLIIGGNKSTSKTPGLQREIQRQIAYLGLNDSVLWIGAKPQAKLPLYYAASEACILPSRYESFGMVALEAMACGRPVIASRVGGLSYTVQDGRTGFLVPEGDAERLSAKIHALLTDPCLREKLGNNALARARRFRWANVVEGLQGLYRGILFTGRPGVSSFNDREEMMEEELGR